MSIVLVTGASGFVGGHVLLAALRAGHTVHATVRSLDKGEPVRNALKQAGVDAGDRLRFFAADLTSDAGWLDAMNGCDFVLHVASPMPKGEPKDPNEVIVPARDGVLRVLRFARDAKVKRVVLTSSCGAIYYGHPPRTAPFDETSWSNLDGEMSSYVRSKVIAERAAWDFIEKEGGGLELTTINPSGVFGPVLGKDIASSVQLIERLLNGMPAAPMLYFAVVDVRDVADLHLLAMTSPAAKGERFIASAGDSMSMLEVSLVLRERLGAKAAKAPSKKMPDWVVRLLGVFSPQMKQLAPLLNAIRTPTSAKAQRVLGWKPRPPADTLVDTANRLLELKA